MLNEFAGDKTIMITYFVHGTSVDNEACVASGWRDTELSELGRTQSSELKEALKGKKFDIVFCSDLKRAIQSSEMVFGDSGLDIIKDRRLRECNYGDFTGEDSKKIDELTFKHIEKPFPNGECYKDVETRVREFLDDLSKTSHKSVALVAHRAPQLALEVILNGRTWKQAVGDDWRSKEPKEWKPGWNYVLRVRT